MASQTNIKKKIFVTSLILTVAIFVIGLLISYVLDIYRMDEITRVIENHETDKTAYLLEEKFIDSVGGDKCAVMNQRFFDLKTDMHKVGIALTNYWSESLIKKIDFDYLKRHYFLLELEFYTLINKLNKECDTDYVTILFFYEKDDADSITEGYILEDISLSYKTNVVVLSLDKDYEDEVLVPLLVKSYNITKAPTMIINNIKMDEFKYGGEINATIKEIIRNASTDKYGGYYDFDYLFKSIGMNKTKYINDMESVLNATNNATKSALDSTSAANEYFRKAELIFLLGRLSKDYNKMCDSLKYYDQAALETDNEEMKAVIYETTVSIGCGRNKKAFLELAAESWKKIGNIKRAEIDLALANNKPLPIQFEISEISPEKIIKPIVKPFDKDTLIIGSSGIEITDKDIMISQVDRVTRDWLGQQLASPYSNNILFVFSERLKYNKTELREDIGWHEGGRVKELKLTGAKHELAVGTIVMEKNGTWYAPNENNVFMFEVPFDKVMYPTTRFLRKDIAMIVDTHGVNMLVEQTIRKNATIVISDCDHPGKVKAAAYLSSKGKTVVCFPDKYGYLALGKNINLLTSPPVKIIKTGNEIKKVENETKTIGDEIKTISNETKTIESNQSNQLKTAAKSYPIAIIGKQPIKINLKEKIIVTNATNLPYAVWYYQTPTNYFSELTKSISLNLIYVTINNFSQMDKIINAAINNNAKVIATRVFNSDDYDKLVSWLTLSKENRAILFHSASYPYGQLILREYPAQVTFGDVNVKFK